MRRIGEILLEHDLVDLKVLERALVKQQETHVRLCSMLIESGLLTGDEAARVLGEQHGVPAALQKHLDHREPELAALIPARIARAHAALPIGRMGNGDLIVCVRDPDPDLQAGLARNLGQPVVLAVAPAVVLEALVLATYADDAEPSEPVEPAKTSAPRPEPTEFEVDLDGEDDDEDLGDAVLGDLADFDAVDDLPDLTNEMMDASESSPGLPGFTLVELDDRGVTKDLSQSGQIQIGPMTRDTLPPATFSGARPVTLPPSTYPAKPPTLPPATVSRPSPTLPPSTRPRSPPTLPPAVIHAPRIEPDGPVPPPDEIAVGTAPPSRASATIPRPRSNPALDAAIAALEAAVSIEAATETVMRFAAGRWKAALLFAINEGAALGLRGHGELLSQETVQAITVPLSSSSIVRAARAAGAVIATVPADAGAIEDRLERLLGLPERPAAAPIAVGGAIEYVLAIGDPADAEADADAAIADLDLVATALGAAYTRLART